MRLKISVTVEIAGRPELVVYAGSLPPGTPEEPIRRAAEVVVRAMLKASSLDKENVVLRHYVGPSVVATTTLGRQVEDDLLLAA
jgi:hypothetical protein